MCCVYCCGGNVHRWRCCALSDHKFVRCELFFFHTKTIINIDEENENTACTCLVCSDNVLKQIKSNFLPLLFTTIFKTKHSKTSFEQCNKPNNILCYEVTSCPNYWNQNSKLIPRVSLRFNNLNILLTDTYRTWFPNVLPCCYPAQGNFPTVFVVFCRTISK